MDLEASETAGQGHHRELHLSLLEVQIAEAHAICLAQNRQGDVGPFESEEASLVNSNPVPSQMAAVGLAESARHQAELVRAAMAERTDLDPEGTAVVAEPVLPGPLERK